MAEPVLGLYTHSRLGRNYAHSRDRLGEAQQVSVSHYTNAMAMQAAHWGGVQEHLATREERIEQG